MKTSQVVLIEEMLDRYYHASNSTNMNPAVFSKRLSVLMNDIAGVKDAAVKRLAELESFEAQVGDLEKRCIISFKHLACLREAFKEV